MKSLFTILLAFVAIVPIYGWLVQAALVEPCSVKTSSARNSFIDELTAKIQGEQVKKDEPYDFPWHFQEEKGLYGSWIHLNYHGDLLKHDIREYLKFFDNNGFVTMFVMQFLLEAHILDADSVPIDSTAAASAIDAVSKFHDRNLPSDNPTMCFWPQVYNKTTNYYQQYPENLVRPIEEEGSLEAAAVKLLDSIGLSHLAKEIIKIVPDFSFFVIAFAIPPDADDSAVNFVLGDILHAVSDEFPDLYKSWLSSNNHNNVSKMFDDYVRYSYVPSDTASLSSSSLDPRSYFIARNYLQEKREQSTSSYEKVRLITTWLTNIERDKTLFYNHESMPYHANNIDGNVQGNALLAIVRWFVLLDKDYEFDNSVPLELIELYNETISYVIWLFERDVLHTIRPDFVLDYYPSTHFFYFTVARSLTYLQGIMEEETQKNEIHSQKLRNLLESVYEQLQKVMRSYASPQLIKMASTKSGMYYWDDFLGSGDTNIEGKPINRAEDRIFSTGFAVNALFDIWTTRTGPVGSMSLNFVEGTPKDVESAIVGGVNWLQKYTLSGEFKPDNAFFSGSAKSPFTNAFFWPTTTSMYLNGTIVDPQSPDAMDKVEADLISAVTGVVSESQYASMLKETWFGMVPNQEFDGYNCDVCQFPLWSSPAMSYVSVLLAMTKYGILVG